MSLLSAGVGIRSIFSMRFANWRRVSEKTNWDQSCSQAGKGACTEGALVLPASRSCMKYEKLPREILILEEEEFMTSEMPDLGGDGRGRDIFSFSKYLRNLACAA